MGVEVHEYDDGIRAAGPPDCCFYCGHKVGTLHKADCVAIKRRVTLKYSFNVDVEVPHSRTPANIIAHRLIGSWCADNAISEINASVGEGDCLCGKLTVEVVTYDPEAAAYGKLHIPVKED